MSEANSSANMPRRVVITGAAQRIGRAIALEFARSGWQVAVHYRSSAGPAHALVEEIEALGVKACALKADLTNLDEISGLIDGCAVALGPPGCLVNNASLFQRDSLASLEVEGWQAHLDTNLRAPVLLSQSFANRLPGDAEGAIINIVDQRVRRPNPDFFSYSLSKAGLWWVTQTMAQALAPRIRVNAVSPGPTLQSIHQSEDEFEAEAHSTLLEHGAAPEDIAQTVRFLAGAPSVTGQMICVDSGQHLSFR